MFDLTIHSKPTCIMRNKSQSMKQKIQHMNNRTGSNNKFEENTRPNSFICHTKKMKVE